MSTPPEHCHLQGHLYFFMHAQFFSLSVACRICLVSPSLLVHEVHSGNSACVLPAVCVLIAVCVACCVCLFRWLFMLFYVGLQFDPQVTRRTGHAP